MHIIITIIVSLSLFFPLVLHISPLPLLPQGQLDGRGRGGPFWGRPRSNTQKHLQDAVHCKQNPGGPQAHVAAVGSSDLQHLPHGDHLPRLGLLLHPTRHPAGPRLPCCPALFRLPDSSQRSVLQPSLWGDPAVLEHPRPAFHCQLLSSPLSATQLFQTGALPLVRKSILFHPPPPSPSSIQIACKQQASLGSAAFPRFSACPV